MKNNIDVTFDKIKKEKRIGVMAHIVTGYPTLSFSKKLISTLVKGGADIIEIQIPFSDPMADGPVIVQACQTSLDHGTKVKNSFELAGFVSKKMNTPTVLMTYGNIIVHMGIRNFALECKKHEISGVIVPDLQ